MLHYTEETLMPFGKHQGTKLANVPPDYLLWCYDNIPKLSGALKQYIDANRHVLEIESLASKQQKRFENR